MKRLALILLAIPLAACATSEQRGQLGATHMAVGAACSSDGCGLYRPPQAVPAGARVYPLTSAMLHRASEAATSCMDTHQGPSNPHFGQCINDYLQYHYGWVIARDTKNAIWAAYPLESNPLAEGSAANFPPTPATVIAVPKAE